MRSRSASNSSSRRAVWISARRRSPAPGGSASPDRLDAQALGQVVHQSIHVLRDVIGEAGAGQFPGVPGDQVQCFAGVAAAQQLCRDLGGGLGPAPLSACGVVEPGIVDGDTRGTGERPDHDLDKSSSSSTFASSIAVSPSTRPISEFVVTSKTRNAVHRPARRQRRFRHRRTG